MKKSSVFASFIVAIIMSLGLGATSANASAYGETWFSTFKIKGISFPGGLLQHYVVGKGFNVSGQALMVTTAQTCNLQLRISDLKDGKSINDIDSKYVSGCYYGIPIGGEVGERKISKSAQKTCARAYFGGSLKAQQCHYVF